MACDLRYRCHQDQEVGFRAACPGQIWSTLEVVTSNGHRMHASVWRLSEENTAASFIKDILQEHPVSASFRPYGPTADCLTLIAGTLLHSIRDQVPFDSIGYADRASAEHDSNSRRELQDPERDGGVACKGASRPDEPGRQA